MKDIKDKHIAVVGVSSNPDKYGFRVFQDLKISGFNVDGVNPKGGEIMGQTIYPSLRDVPTAPDLVVTVVPPPVTEAVVEQCGALGIREIWMQPGSESEAAVKKARQNNIMVTYNACIMTSNHIW